MPLLDNPRHERFAVNVAKGMSQAEAYRKVYGKDRVGATQQATALMKDHDISARVAEISAQLTAGDVASKLEVNEFLTRVIRTPVGNVDEASPLCERVKVTAESTEYRMPSKLGAIDLLAKIQRWLDNSKNETNVNVAVQVNVLTEDQRREVMDQRRRVTEALRAQLTS